ncbi:unnamed protein product [Spirodela intermedia]|uniref:Uncharacterized protein n=1 Tax=Spirodela intermedia TaxID=51605 RepID=A0A7I8JZP6_SPIIN|nr:unnamed protein product [Spirodela intermedia]
MTRTQLSLVMAHGQPPLAKAIQATHRRLLFVEAAAINTITTRVLVDSKATHNFLSKREVSCLRLRLVQINNRIKVVNSKPQASVGLAPQLDFLVLWMDNFDVMLGTDFVVKANVMIFLHYN